MSAIREFCIALLGGAVGVTGTVGTTHVIKPKKAAVRHVKKVPKPAPAPRAAPVIPDCPVPSISLGAMSVPGGSYQLGDISEGLGFAPSAYSYPVPIDDFFVVPGPGENPPDLPPGATVPEVGTWATMIIGFGIIGLSARRKNDGTHVREA